MGTDAIATRVQIVPTIALMDVSATWTSVATTVRVMTATTIVLVAAPLHRDALPDRTSIVAPICQECSVRPASASAMRPPIAICSRLLSLWTNTPRPTYRPRTDLQSNRNGSVAGKRNLGILLRCHTKLCGRTARHTTSRRMTWTARWTGSVSLWIRMTLTLSD